MKQSFKSLLSIAALVCTIAFNAVAETPTYKIRSQSRDKARQLVGTEATHAHFVGMEDNWWGFFTMTPEYTSSFNSSNICNCLFGGSVTNIPTTTVTTSNCGDCNSSCGCCSILIQGHNVADRSETAWLADYFYLNPDFNGSISFSPNIRNFILDFDLYLGLDKWLEGMYFRIYGPFVHSRWNLDFGETITTEGDDGYVAGYFSPEAIDAEDLLQSFASYAAGNAPATIAATATNTAITFRPLQFAKIGSCARSENGFADLRMELGWNFWNEDRYHVGLNIQAAAPTGKKMCAEYLFNPQIGNGHHWELGGGLTAHYVFWRSEDENRNLGFYLDLNVTHIFKAKEQRTFDLIGKPMSRYMLAAQFDTNNFALRGTSTTGTLASDQFSGVYSPVANLTTMKVEVSAAAQVDLVAMFNFTSGGFSWDLGYNFWYQSCEKIGCPDNCDDCDSSCAPCGGTPVVNLCDADQADTWALKGDARMFGFGIDGGTTTAAPVVAAGQAVALSATNSNANIFNGTTGNVLTAVDGTSDNDNPATGVTPIDNAQVAFAGGATPLALTVSDAAGSAAIYTSIQPVFLSCSDIDFKGVRGLSNKVFTHLSYTFDRENWAPFIGVGAFGEFGQSDCGSSCSTGGCDTDCNDSCGSCINCSLSQWGVWLKAGLAFN